MTDRYDAAGNTLVKWQQGPIPMIIAFDAVNQIVMMTQCVTLTAMTYDNNGDGLRRATVVHRRHRGDDDLGWQRLPGRVLKDEDGRASAAPFPV